MNWDAVAALSEAVGAIGVIASLIFLIVQLRQNTKAMRESNVLERAMLMDRHTDSVGRWRSSVAENEGLATIWHKRLTDQTLSDVEGIRLNNLFINFVNTQRSNFERALVVGEPGMAQQASRSVAIEIVGADTLYTLWLQAKPWHSLASPEFVARVEGYIEEQRRGPTAFKSGSWIRRDVLEKRTGDTDDRH